MNTSCQIEFVSSDSDVGMPCGKAAVAKGRVNPQLTSQGKAARC
jgi:hypothetical protein